MTHHHKTIFPLLLCLLSISSCGEKCVTRAYDLEANISISPVQATYSVGDTLSVNFFFPNPILNRRTLLLERINSLNIRHGWWISRLDSVDRVQPVTDQYVEVIPTGTTVGSLTTDPEGRYSDVTGTLERLPDGAYASNYQFVIRRTGYLLFSIGQFVQDEDQVDRPIVLETGCASGSYSISYVNETVPDNNVDLLCKSDPPLGFCNDVSEEDVEEFNLTGKFVLKVE